MFWIGSYCVLCWLVGAPFLIWTAMRGAADDAETEETRKAINTPGVVPLFVACLPFWLPIVFVQSTKFLLQQLILILRLRRARKTYREPNFQAVRYFDLAPYVRSGFEQWNGEYLSLGFEMLGDFQTKSDPVPVFNRCYVGCEGTVFADVTALLDQSCVGMVSLLMDGTCISTSGMDDFGVEGQQTDEDLLHVAMAGKRPLPELLDMHLVATEYEAMRRGTQVMSIAPERFQDVFIFDARRYGRWRQRCGETRGKIPAPDVPSGRAVDPQVLRRFGSAAPAALDSVLVPELSLGAHS